MEDKNSENVNSEKVKTQLDSILEKHFRKLDQISVLEEKIRLNMSSVAALHLAVEREEELEIDGADKVERYSRKTFIKDLTELGLEIDDELMVSFERLHAQGYLRIDSDGFYYAELSAITIVENFNSMFPGMPGMNLVAYIIQTLDEIITGRKDFEKGITQFDQALQSRGRALSFVFLRTEKKNAKQIAEDRQKKAVELTESRKATELLRKKYSIKISEFRKSTMDRTAEPSVLTKRAIDVNEINVKEISPRKVQEAKEKAEKERLEAERLEKERLEKELEELKRLEEERLEKERLELERQALEAKKAEEERLELERLENEKLEQERLEEERLEAERKESERIDAERLEAERLERERVEKELAIEAQIAEFEQEMAPSCPICGHGKIINDKTTTDKNYFKCSNEGCKFISWTKPYIFTCPICSSPYLTEFSPQGGGTGLKCPRASCSYSQDNLFNPAPPPAAQAHQAVNQQAVPGSVPLAQPKKRRLVRRRKK